MDSGVTLVWVGHWLIKERIEDPNSGITLKGFSDHEEKTNETIKVN